MQMMPDVQPLATIEFQGVAWPVAWTRNFGKGRVFHTNLGHRAGKTRPRMTRSATRTSALIVQGMVWVAAGRPATAKPLNREPESRRSRRFAEHQRGRINDAHAP